MDVIINLANDIFKPILAMGGPIIMLIILTVLALLFGKSDTHAEFLHHLPRDADV